MKEVVVLTVTEKTADLTRLKLEYQGKVVAHLESDDMFILMAAMLLALGYQSFQIELHASEVRLTAEDVRAAMASQLDAVFEAATAQLGDVTLWERYSEELCEFRLNLKVDGANVGTSIDRPLRTPIFGDILSELGYDVFETLEPA